MQHRATSLLGSALWKNFDSPSHPSNGPTTKKGPERDPMMKIQRSRIVGGSKWMIICKFHVYCLFFPWFHPPSGLLQIIL